MVLVDNGFKPVVWLYRIRDNGLIKMANVEIVDHNTDYCLNIIWYVRFSFSLTLQVSFKPYLLFFFSLCTISQNIRRDSSFTYLYYYFLFYGTFSLCGTFLFYGTSRGCFRIIPVFFSCHQYLIRRWIGYVFFLPDPDCKLLDCD